MKNTIAIILSGCCLFSAWPVFAEETIQAKEETITADELRQAQTQRAPESVKTQARTESQNAATELVSLTKTQEVDLGGAIEPSDVKPKIASRPEKSVSRNGNQMAVISESYAISDLEYFPSPRKH